ncbi:hypothetical protein H8N01_18260 [Streptomyces sp. AC536]|uniref:hypothetical protein n=2 Tax=Streptomyces TaxID=1883 RepID=UPI00164E9B56|nr:hypothetical protein [Streptomyces buecherae]MBC3984461.1 hypothetical protein [Streptomyces buecherae]QNJ42583.1 hypothetical protein H7H31_24850 [Streptomyces buecherae]
MSARDLPERTSVTTSSDATPDAAGADEPTSRPQPPAPEPTGGSAVDWALLVCGSLLLLGVVVDVVEGEGLAWVTLAWTLILMPEGVRRIFAGRGHTRRAELMGPVAGFCTAAATAICWAGLAYDWSRGNGTSWLVLIGTVLLTVGGVAWLVRRLLERR